MEMEHEHTYASAGVAVAQAPDGPVIMAVLFCPSCGESWIKLPQFPDAPPEPEHPRALKAPAMKGLRR